MPADGPCPHESTPSGRASCDAVCDSSASPSARQMLQTVPSSCSGIVWARASDVLTRVRSSAGAAGVEVRSVWRVLTRPRKARSRPPGCAVWRRSRSTTANCSRTLATRSLHAHQADRRALDRRDRLSSSRVLPPQSAMGLAINSVLTLNDGERAPQLGFGVRSLVDGPSKAHARSSTSARPSNRRRPSLRH